MVKLGRKQKRHAKEKKGVAGVCLLQREMYLLLSMGGAITNIENQGFGEFNYLDRERIRED